MRGFGWAIFAIGIASIYQMSGQAERPMFGPPAAYAGDKPRRERRDAKPTIDPPAALATWSVTGKPRLESEAAWTDALNAASASLMERLNLETEVPHQFIRQHIVTGNHTEFIRVDEANADLPRVTLDLTLTAETRKELATLERHGRVTQRMKWTGRGLAALVAGLIALAGYIRFDEWTKGYASGVLRAAFTALAIAAAALVWLKW